MTTACEYCGTGLQEDGETTDTGQRHYVAQCREYVAISRNAYAKEAAALAGLLNELTQAVLASPSADAACIVIANRARNKLQPKDCDFTHPHPEHPCGRHLSGPATPEGI